MLITIFSKSRNSNIFVNQFLDTNQDMKFIVSSSQLLKQLQVLGGVINSNNTLPILDNFLFELSENKLKVSASDLETTMSAEVDVESDSTGSIAVSARLLLDTLKTFPDQPLTFKTDSIVSKRTSLESGSDEIKFTFPVTCGSIMHLCFRLYPETQPEDAKILDDSHPLKRPFFTRGRRSAIRCGHTVTSCTWQR